MTCLATAGHRARRPVDTVGLCLGDPLAQATISRSLRLRHQETSWGGFARLPSRKGFAKCPPHGHLIHTQIMVIFESQGRDNDVRLLTKKESRAASSAPEETEYPTAPGTPIRYSPDRVSELTTEHRQLLVLYSALRWTVLERR